MQIRSVRTTSYPASFGLPRAHDAKSWANEIYSDDEADYSEISATGIKSYAVSKSSVLRGTKYLFKSDKSIG